jgi:hypothetical protein
MHADLTANILSRSQPHAVCTFLTSVLLRSQAPCLAKENQRTLVLLAPELKIPIELQQDILIISASPSLRGGLSPR